MAQTSRLVVEIDSRDAEQKAADTRKALEALEDAGLRVKPALDTAGKGLDGVGKSATKSTKSIQEERNEIEQLLESINPLTKKLNELERQEAALNKARKSGKIELDTYNEYSTKLKATRDELGRFNESLGKTGVSAKQTAAALRGVPAQFTDIAVSLQGGQAPLTVLLQQGGQLKDMFGGIGPAAKALGGYVLGLVNPFTVAAAAAAGLGIAYYQGSKEADAYRNALVNTGNSAGTTAGALSSMASSIGGTVGTTGEAAAALALLAENGKIARGSFEGIATAAVASQEATGRAVSETIAEFAKIADDPVKAAQTLNDQYNFLTAAVYNQIVALKAQGKETEAARLLTDTYADAVRSRATQVTTNLGSIERAWASISLETRKTIDAVLNVGRLEDSAKKITELTQKVAAAQSAINADPDDTANRKKLDESKQELAYLTQQRDTQAAIAAAEGLSAENQRKAIDSTAQFNAELKSGANNAEKRAEAIKALNKQIADNVQNGTPLADEKIARRIADINEQFKDPAVKKELQYREDAGQKMLDNARQQYAVLQQQGALIGQQGDGAKTLGAEAKKLLELEQQIAQLKEKGSLTTAQKQILAMGELNIAQQKQNAALEKENELRKIANAEAAKLLTFTESINDKLALSQQGLSSQLAGIGLGQEGRKRLQDDLKIRQDYQKDMDKLQAQFNSGDLSKELYEKETAMLEDALDQRLSMQEDYYAQLQKAQSDWTNGANAAWQDYVDEANDIAGQTYDAFRNAFDGLEDSLTSFVTGGKLSFKDLADSIIADIARIIIKTQVVTPLLNSLFGGGGGNGSSSFGGAIGSILGGGNASDSNGWGGFLSLGKNLYSAWSNLTGVGSSIASGYASGGVGGAISGGVGYYGNLLSSLGTTLSGGFSSIVGAITGSTATQVAANAATSAALQGAVAQGATQVGTSIGIGGAAAAGAGTAAAAGAGAGFYASLAAMASNPVGWVIAAVTSAYQSGKLYDQGVRWNTKDVMNTDLVKYSGGIGQATLAPLAITNNVLEKIVGGKMAAIFSGSTFASAIITKASEKIFGGSWVTKDGGLSLGIDGGDFDARQYINQKKKGGLFSSSKKRTRYSALDPQMEEALKANYYDTQYSVLDLFARLNVALNDGVMDGLNVANTKISTKGKTADQIQEAITKWFGGVANSMVSAVDSATNSGLGNYNFEELTTFVNNLYSVNDSFEMLGLKLYDVSVSTGFMAEQLIAMAGGLEALKTAESTFFDGFYTDVEKADYALSTVNEQFAAIGVTLPATRDAYRGMVEALDLTTESGRQMYIMLTGMSDSAAQAYSILEQRADAAAAAAKELADALKEALMGSVSSAMSAVQRAISAQQQKATEAYNATNTSLTDMVSTVTENVNGLNSVSTSLSTALKALRGDSDDAVKMLRAQAQATLQSALATARSGKSLSGFTGLEDALDTVSNNNAGLYGSMEAFARDQGRTANVVAELNALNGKQLTSAEKSLEGLKAQIDQAKKSYDLQMSQYDAQLTLAQAQIDALNGVDNSVVSVAAAVNSLSQAIVASLAIKGDDSARQNTFDNNAAIVRAVYRTVLGRDAEAKGLNDWAGALTGGLVTYDELMASIARQGRINGENVLVPGFASGGVFSGGLRLVGERGPELEVTGPSRIYNANQTAAMLSGGSSNAAIVAELRAVRAELESIKANTQASAQSGGKLVRTIDRVTDGGNAMLTKELA